MAEARQVCLVRWHRLRLNNLLGTVYMRSSFCTAMLCGFISCSFPCVASTITGEESGARLSSSFVFPTRSVSTSLLSLQQTTTNSEYVRSYKNVQYESASGELISLRHMYSTKWTDTQVLFLTSFADEDYGLIWGFTTGERALKYEIDPSLLLGWVQRWTLSKSQTLTLNALVAYGGKLKERTCLADYGDIGGVQNVNCRLAATTLSPEETLAYLSNKRPKLNRVSLRWQMQF